MIPRARSQPACRDLRKERFGAYKVEKRRRGAIAGGVWETRLGEKGAGDPIRRKGGQVPESFISLAHIADSLLRHLEHRKTCSIFKVLEGRPCDCGLGPGLNAYPRRESKHCTTSNRRANLTDQRAPTGPLVRKDYT